MLYLLVADSSRLTFRFLTWSLALTLCNTIVLESSLARLSLSLSLSYCLGRCALFLHLSLGLCISQFINNSCIHLSPSLIAHAPSSYVHTSPASHFDHLFEAGSLSSRCQVFYVLCPFLCVLLPLLGSSQ